MLGMRIAALRRQAGMSQQELAQRLGVSASTVGMYEQGRREPSGERLVAIASVFGVSTDYLLTGQPHVEVDEAHLQALMEQLLAGARGELTLTDGQGSRPVGQTDVAMLLAALLGQPDG